MGQCQKCNGNLDRWGICSKCRPKHSIRFKDGYNNITKCGRELKADRTTDNIKEVTCKICLSHIKDSVVE